MKHKIGTIELPELSEVAKVLEVPDVISAEDALTAAKKAADDARKRLAELSHLCESLPHAIVEGRAPQSALQENIDSERSCALVLKSHEGKIESAREDLEFARAEGRDKLLDEAAKIIEHLKKVVAPILPVLEATKAIEYEVESIIDVAFLDPATGTPRPRAQLAAILWPESVRDEQAARSWMETAVSGSMRDEK